MGDSSSANPTAKDVILEGNGRQVYLPIFAQNNPIPQTELQIYKFRLEVKSCDEKIAGSYGI